MNIAYKITGAGPPIVLLHAFPLNRSMWRDQVRALDEYQVIAPDLRGLGESDNSGTATMEEMAGDVAELLNRLGIETAIIAGLSLGGYVALAFYRLWPHRTRSLVLADTREQADAPEIKSNREVMAVRALKDGMNAVAHAMLPRLLSANTLESRPELVSRVREMILSNRPEGVAAALRGMAVRRDQTDLLPQIPVPTLIITGRDDAVTPPSEAERMHHNIPRSKLAIIEGAGHLSNVEQADEFNKILLDFLQGLSHPGTEK